MGSRPGATVLPPPQDPGRAPRRPAMRFPLPRQAVPFPSPRCPGSRRIPAPSGPRGDLSRRPVAASREQCFHECETSRHRECTIEIRRPPARHVYVEITALFGTSDLGTDLAIEAGIWRRRRDNVPPRSRSASVPGGPASLSPPTPPTCWTAVLLRQLGVGVEIPPTPLLRLTSCPLSPRPRTGVPPATWAGDFF